MSALVIVKRGRVSYPGFHLCVGGCRHKTTHAKDAGVKTATHIALICGRPAAGLCERCARQWTQDWEAAKGPAPVQAPKVETPELIAA